MLFYFVQSFTIMHKLYYVRDPNHHLLMNRITTLLMICMLCSTSAYCQYINVPTTIKTPYGNVKTSTSMYVGRPYYSSWKKFRSTDTYNIKVVFKNDSTVKTNGMLMVSDS